MTSQKFKLVKLWDIQKEKHEKARFQANPFKIG